MTRVKISACILSSLVILSIIFGFWINLKCSRLIDISNNIRICLENGDKDSAVKEAEEFGISWESFRSPASIMIKSDRLSEISRINTRIIPMIEMDSDETYADLNELTELLILLKNGEIPILTSLF